MTQYATMCNAVCFHFLLLWLVCIPAAFSYGVSRTAGESIQRCSTVRLPTSTSLFAVRKNDTDNEKKNTFGVNISIKILYKTDRDVRLYGY